MGNKICGGFVFLFFCILLLDSIVTRIYLPNFFFLALRYIIWRRKKNEKSQETKNRKTKIKKNVLSEESCTTRKNISCVNKLNTKFKYFYFSIHTKSLYIIKEKTC